MKIASLYSFRAYPPRGGNHVHAYQLIRRFIARGHEVLTLGDDSIPGVRSFPRTIAGLRALLSISDILYVRVDANQLRKDPLMLQLHREARPPIVWEINAPANESLAFSYLAGSTLEKRPFEHLRRELHALRQRPGIATEERTRRQLARNVAAAICVSNGVAEYARSGLHIRHVHMIPNGADHEGDTPNGPLAHLPADWNENLIVLFAGSPMYPWQGLGVLDETIRLCATANDPIRFVLLLNQARTQRADPPNCLTIVGTPHIEVASYLRASDCAVVLHPPFHWSQWGPHGSPMKLFDYMACGKPVIATANGQLAEVVRTGRNGMLFDGSPESLRSALLKLASGDLDLGAMGSAARADVESEYNWHVIGDRTLSILESARERSPSTTSRLNL